MKTTGYIFLFILGVALGSPSVKPEGIGAAFRLFGRSSPFIVDGEVVEGRQFPGQISLQYMERHNCGGSILSESYILTAAHCSHYEPSVLSVLSGSNSLFNGTKHNVLEIHVHEKYSQTDSYHNDIAVMKIDPPFVFDENTAPVSLPSSGQETPVGSKATVIGWGRVSDGGPISNDLLKVDIFISDHDICKEFYQSYLTVYDEQICAGSPEGDKGSCRGDSGGPLFVDGKVIGLVSWAQGGCAAKGVPTVFTEVAHYIDWILSKINA